MPAVFFSRLSMEVQSEFVTIDITGHSTSFIEAANSISNNDGLKELSLTNAKIKGTELETKRFFTQLAEDLQKRVTVSPEFTKSDIKEICKVHARLALNWFCFAEGPVRDATIRIVEDIMIHLKTGQSKPGNLEIKVAADESRWEHKVLNNISNIATATLSEDGRCIIVHLPSIDKENV